MNNACDSVETLHRTDCSIRTKYSRSSWFMNAAIRGTFLIGVALMNCSIVTSSCIYAWVRDIVTDKGDCIQLFCYHYSY